MTTTTEVHSEATHVVSAVQQLVTSLSTLTSLSERQSAVDLLLDTMDPVSRGCLQRSVSEKTLVDFLADLPEELVPYILEFFYPNEALLLCQVSKDWMLRVRRCRRYWLKACNECELLITPYTHEDHFKLFLAHKHFLDKVNRHDLPLLSYHDLPAPSNEIPLETFALCFRKGILAVGYMYWCSEKFHGEPPVFDTFSKICFWDVTECKVVNTLTVNARQLGAWSSVDFEDEFVVVGGRVPQVHMMRITGELIRTFHGHVNHVAAVGLSCNSRVIVSVDNNHTFIIWNMDSAAILKTWSISYTSTLPDSSLLEFPLPKFKFIPLSSLQESVQISNNFSESDIVQQTSLSFDRILKMEESCGITDVLFSVSKESLQIFTLANQNHVVEVFKWDISDFEHLPCSSKLCNTTINGKSIFLAYVSHDDAVSGPLGHCFTIAELNLTFNLESNGKVEVNMAPPVVEVFRINQLCITGTCSLDLCNSCMCVLAANKIYTVFVLNETCNSNVKVLVKRNGVNKLTVISKQSIELKRLAAAELCSLDWLEDITKVQVNEPLLALLLMGSGLEQTGILKINEDFIQK